MVILPDIAATIAGTVYSGGNLPLVLLLELLLLV
jgi:hypothetical protein